MGGVVGPLVEKSFEFPLELAGIEDSPLNDFADAVGKANATLLDPVFALNKFQSEGTIAGDLFGVDNQRGIGGLGKAPEQTPLSPELRAQIDLLRSRQNSGF